jgi:hypothetical protein
MKKRRAVARGRRRQNPKDKIGLTKAPLRLIPPAALLHIARAMGEGAQKYGPYNWREFPISISVYIEAAQRHLLALLDGEDRAPDSGFHHAAHAAACMTILLDALETGNLIDDRHSGPGGRLLAAWTPPRRGR